MTSAPELRGRTVECAQFDRLLEGARGGSSSALVVRGEAGVGKSALLQYPRDRPSDCAVAGAAGVESEMELAFAGLHQVCAPFLDRLGDLPSPQADALRTAFGLHVGPPADPFLVGLAVLSLLSEVAEARPLVCLVDDMQWLDRASAQVLGFVARRLGEESVVVVFAVREPDHALDLTKVPEMTVGPLADPDARAILASAIAGKLDVAVRDRIVAESRGNPLALLEMPRAWTPAAFAGGFGLPDTVPVSGRIEESFRRRMKPLPDDSKLLMLVVASEPVGDPALMPSAADRLGIPMAAAGPAAVTGLLDVGTHLRFRHPLCAALRRCSSLNSQRRTTRAAPGTGAADYGMAWHHGDLLGGTLCRGAGRKRGAQRPARRRDDAPWLTALSLASSADGLSARLSSVTPRGAEGSCALTGS